MSAASPIARIPSCSVRFPLNPDSQKQSVGIYVIDCGMVMDPVMLSMNANERYPSDLTVSGILNSP